MSQGCSCITSGDPQDHLSKKIDMQLRKERQKLKRQVKILLLGSGESGKSTFVKQMVIIYGAGEFTADEMREYRQIIYQNVILAMRTLIEAKQRLHIPWENPQRQSEADFLVSIDNPRAVDGKSFHDWTPLVSNLWEDGGIKQSYARRNLFQINYVPTNRDILFARRATRTIADHQFLINKVPFRFIDVGGQRSQRQKWYQCFEGITSILFLVATSEYDQVLLEDKHKNRLVESREVFDTIVNHRAFNNVSIILFLNKSDLLAKKVHQSDIRQTFPDFKGDHKKVQDVQFYLLNYFSSAKKESTRPFFYHFTVAVDTDNIRRVFQDVRDTILDQNLRMLMMQ